MGSLNAHWLAFNACAAEGSVEYDPFCGTGSFREIELGLVYHF
jgi:tRNA G10  N-methylase Trm11